MTSGRGLQWVTVGGVTVGDKWEVLQWVTSRRGSVQWVTSGRGYNVCLIFSCKKTAGRHIVPAYM